MTLKTTTVIITVRTASEAHGTGADTILLGTHGVTVHGDTTDGMILTGMEDGMTHGTIQVGTIHIGTADGMTHGTTGATGTTIITTTAGTTRIGTIITISREDRRATDTTGRGMKPAPTGYSAAEHQAAGA